MAGLHFVVTLNNDFSPVRPDSNISQIAEWVAVYAQVQWKVGLYRLPNH